MALKIPRGINPTETWELDYVAAEAQHRLERLRSLLAEMKPEVEQEKDPKKKKALEADIARSEKAAAALEADLAAYQPGSGPIFVLGHIPNGKRAELRGEQVEVLDLPFGKDRVVRDRAWAESVVRWGVKGHRNLVWTAGPSADKPVEFKTEEDEFAGRKVQVVSRETLEAYGSFDVLGSLAVLVLRGQQVQDPNA